MNLSLMTNLLSATIFVIAYLIPRHYWWREHLLQMGLFALSGAFTNWIAVYMLFEKIPGFYGSGIIPNRFQEFKKAIRALIMNNFFTQENFEKYVANSIREEFDMDKILDKLFDEILNSLKDTFGGPKWLVYKAYSLLTSMREPFKKKASVFLNKSDVLQTLKGSDAFSKLKQQVETIVDQKLEELTPKKVKEIIQNMIRKHLGWLVLWGGVFGALLGLLSSLCAL